MSGFKLLQVKFRNFDVEYSWDCLYDRLTFSTDSGVKSFCGKAANTSSSSISSSSLVNLLTDTEDKPDLNKLYYIRPNRTVVMQFLTDGRFQISGFEIETKFLCPLKYFNHTQTNLTNSENNSSIRPRSSKMNLTMVSGTHSKILNCSNYEIWIESEHPHDNSERSIFIFKFPSGCLAVNHFFISLYSKI